MVVLNFDHVFNLSSTELDLYRSMLEKYDMLPKDIDVNKLYLTAVVLNNHEMMILLSEHGNMITVETQNRALNYLKKKLKIHEKTKLALEKTLEALNAKEQTGDVQLPLSISILDFNKMTSFNGKSSMMQRYANTALLLADVEKFDIIRKDPRLKTQDIRGCLAYNETLIQGDHYLISHIEDILSQRQSRGAIEIVPNATFSLEPLPKGSMELSLTKNSTPDLSLEDGAFSESTGFKNLERVYYDSIRLPYKTQIKLLKSLNRYIHSQENVRKSLINTYLYLLELFLHNFGVPKGVFSEENNYDGLQYYSKILEILPPSTLDEINSFLNRKSRVSDATPPVPERLLTLVPFDDETKNALLDLGLTMDSFDESKDFAGLEVAENAVDSFNPTLREAVLGKSKKLPSRLWGIVEKCLVSKYKSHGVTLDSLFGFNLKTPFPNLEVIGEDMEHVTPRIRELLVANISTYDSTDRYRLGPIAYYFKTGLYFNHDLDAEVFRAENVSHLSFIEPYHYFQNLQGLTHLVPWEIREQLLQYDHFVEMIDENHRLYNVVIEIALAYAVEQNLDKRIFSPMAHFPTLEYLSESKTPLAVMNSVLRTASEDEFFPWERLNKAIENYFARADDLDGFIEFSRMYMRKPIPPECLRPELGYPGLPEFAHKVHELEPEKRQEILDALRHFPEIYLSNEEFEAVLQELIPDNHKREFFEGIILGDNLEYRCLKTYTPGDVCFVEPEFKGFEELDLDCLQHLPNEKLRSFMTAVYSNASFPFDRPGIRSAVSALFAHVYNVSYEDARKLADSVIQKRGTQISEFEQDHPFMFTEGKWLDIEILPVSRLVNEVPVDVKNGILRGSSQSTFDWTRLWITVLFLCYDSNLADSIYIVEARHRASEFIRNNQDKILSDILPEVITNVDYDKEFVKNILCDFFIEFQHIFTTSSVVNSDDPIISHMYNLIKDRVEYVDNQWQLKMVTTSKEVFLETYKRLPAGIQTAVLKNDLAKKIRIDKGLDTDVDIDNESIVTMAILAPEAMGELLTLEKLRTVPRDLTNAIFARFEKDLPGLVKFFDLSETEQRIILSKVQSLSSKYRKKLLHTIEESGMEDVLSPKYFHKLPPKTQKFLLQKITSIRPEVIAKLDHIRKNGEIETMWSTSGTFPEGSVVLTHLPAETVETTDGFVHNIMKDDLDKPSLKTFTKAFPLLAEHLLITASHAQKFGYEEVSAKIKNFVKS